MAVVYFPCSNEHFPESDIDNDLLSTGRLAGNGPDPTPLPRKSSSKACVIMTEISHRNLGPSCRERCAAISVFNAGSRTAEGLLAPGAKDPKNLVRACCLVSCSHIFSPHHLLFQRNNHRLAFSKSTSHESQVLCLGLSMSTSTSTSEISAICNLYLHARTIEGVQLHTALLADAP